ncbi:MAG: hypothetical protein R2698_11260 [Microthrixaceae bacterium]
MTTQSVGLVAQLRNAGVTTVGCFCDPLLLKALTVQTNSQRYFPEFVNTGVAFVDQDLVGQLFAPQVWKRAIGPSYAGATVPEGRGPGYQAYRAAGRTDQPSIAVDLIYSQIQLLAIGVQLAGPNLRPDTYRDGMFQYPESSGPLGTWKFGPDDYTTSQDSREVYWDPTRKSVMNGDPGSYVETQPGKRYRIGEYPAGDATVPGIAP